MSNPSTARSLVAAALFCLSAPLLAAIQLTPVVSSGLSSPLFVGHAGDGSNRLFIAERGGIVRVLQPGASVPTVFLDLHLDVLAGGERGLLGLAFHPQYAGNGRFFVFYTRAGDGTIVIAEYGVSGNPNVANATGTVLLTIPHPAGNHNGGMLAFGSDGYLYVAVGDGGSADDPPNNAQNIDVLLGKILRLDVDQPDPGAGTRYSSPASNPYVGEAGRDEIFSIGWRNPWRFSFDRDTFQQWVADVGQGAREEVSTPIVNGGNYGWRVYEGLDCTDNDSALCVPSNYLFPVFDYTHSGGRCSITGGYVYRGTQNALPLGTYVYGDYCSGEILAWNGATQSVLLDTTMRISSFGEDEQGELYVVDLGGTVSKIVSTTPCTFNIAPTGQSFAASGGTGSVAVTAGAGCGWTAVANASWLHVTSGGSGSGGGNVGYRVDANSSSSARNGTLTIAGRTFTVSQGGTAPCVFSIAPTKASYGRGGGGGSVAVTAGVGCAWTAVSNATWITIVGGASGSGNGTVNYSVAANTAPRAKRRSGTVSIAGKTFTVAQAK
jgi:Glucose / Sorbosone dehydrogenase/Viral BACON domain/Putative binding domain, N-terminal